MVNMDSIYFKKIGCNKKDIGNDNVIVKKLEHDLEREYGNPTSMHAYIDVDFDDLQ